MKTVRQIAEEIVAREGGFVNDPHDPGGATNYGVTIHTMRRLKVDLDRDGDVDTQDVRMLTRIQAVAIFVQHYYTNPRVNLLPEKLQASVFDMYVNAGSNAVKILQRLLNSYGWRLTVDGVVGPFTAKAANSVFAGHGQALVDAYGIARRNYYLRLGDGRPTLRKFARTRAGGKGGWIKRAEEFISPQYHLTNQQFIERVSSWG